MSPFISIILFLAISSTAFGLRCYDCDPKTVGCKQPDKQNVKDTYCEDNTSETLKKFVRSEETGDGSFSCLSFYFESNETDLTGIYRGCYPKSGSLDACDSLQADGEQTKNGKISSCKSCQDDRCNVHEVNGSSGMTVTWVVLLGAALCFYFANF